VNYLRGLARSAVQLESWWFDTLHRVNTRATQQDLTGERGDLSKGFWYIPTRPSIARKILGQLPIEHLESYCFVDFGSGKGRLLLIAGEFPFACVQGVERDLALHALAGENLRSAKNFKHRCQLIQPLHVEASLYEFPRSNLVLYFFNPFGEDIFAKLLDKLGRSIQEQPRSVLIVLLYPQYDYLVARSGYFSLHSQSSTWKIYTHFPRAP
jgi:hypothetical protein